MFTHRLDQGSASAGLGCYGGGGTGSGLKWGGALLGQGAGHTDMPQGSGRG